MEASNRMTKSDQVLEVIKDRGPLFPADIVKQIGGDTILVGALISDLISRGKVLVTRNLRVGNSPLYYVQGQESRLVNYFDYLDESYRRAVEILKRNGVLFDSDIPDVYLTSLQKTPDFAIPLVITVGTKKYTAYKWFLLPDADAKPMIQKKLEEIKKENHILEQKEIDAVKVKEDTHALEESTPAATTPIISNDKEYSKEELLALSKGSENLDSDVSTHSKKESSAPQHVEEQSSLGLVSLEEDLTNDLFFKKIFSVLHARGAQLESYEILKKEKEINCIVQLKTGFGFAKYLVKGLDKKRLNENDIKIVYADSQIEGLPCILLTDAELNAKSKKILSHKFQSVVVSSFE